MHDLRISPPHPPPSLGTRRWCRFSVFLVDTLSSPFPPFSRSNGVFQGFVDSTFRGVENMGSSNRIVHILLMFYFCIVVRGDGFPRTAHASTSTAHQNGLLVLGNCRGRPVITPFFYHGRYSFWNVCVEVARRILDRKKRWACYGNVST